ncbi:hypothetical protein QTP81_15465 [Alteromonas sp. ASW11-36]|uniref:Uncharacterized protein n=1 Tax=Alteromonas arenosi TaxID=3055817 RepID=A0ABT7T0M6_9ALTE|nr:hypothetical protein [Alteromonas sp. ASW11-36]MDM7862001.1 hypothetical protein [Alteromonas sp. ASW11-36]
MRQQRTKQKASQKAKQADAELGQDSTDNPEADSTDSFENRKNILWVILAAGMAITVMTSQFMPGVVALGSLTSVYSAMLWVGIFGAALARYLNKNGWLGFAIGSVLGVLLNILASII